MRRKVAVEVESLEVPMVLEVVESAATMVYGCGDEEVTKGACGGGGNVLLCKRKFLMFGVLMKLFILSFIVNSVRFVYY